MVPVKVQKISFHPPSRSYAVILSEINGERKLPVIVGSFEAQSIALALEAMDTPRPLTHDLIGLLINEIDDNNKGLIEHTDIFLWGLFLQNTNNSIIVNDLGYIERCKFKKGLLTISAKIDRK